MGGGSEQGFWHWLANKPNQARVVQMLNSAITIQWITQYYVIHWIVSRNLLICWIVIYPVDSAIQLLNNQGQRFSFFYGVD